MSRKIISLMLAMCLVIGIFGAVPVFAAPNSGSCGNGVRWEVSDDKTTLTISGEGSVRDYWEDDYAGWYYYAQDSITKLIIRNGVTGIGDYAFFEMSNIETVVIPASVTYMGTYAFDCCDNIKTIHFAGDEDEWEALFGGYELPENTTVYFAGDEEYTPEVCFEFANGIITGYTGSYTEIVIPSVINGETVTTIGDYAFQDNGNITSVVIPDTVTTINSYAFDNCYMLENIELPDSVTTIGNYAFRWTAIESIDLPSKLTKISEGMLNQTQLKYIIIPSGVVVIDQFAFYCCGSLKHIVIPATVTDINYSAFHWSGVTDVYYEGASAPKYISSYNDPIKNATKHFNYTKATGISMRNQTAEMWVGDSAEFEVVFAPQSAAFTLCKWTSSNENIATVDAYGTVTAHKGGEVVITAISVDGGFSASCTVTVKNVALTSFNIIEDEVELVINEDYEVDFQYTPQNATLDSLIWTTNNPDVACVENGVIHAFEEGTAVITGSTADGTLSDTITVNVVGSYGSGTLDNGITWNIDPDRTLTISGSGDMPDYWINEYENADGTATGKDKEDFDLGNPAPWYEFAEDIESIYVDDGITSIGDYCFYNLHRTMEIILPEGLKKIGKNAFSHIWEHFEMELPDSVEIIDDYAFAHSNAEFITGMPSSLETIGDYAFYYHNLSTCMQPIIPNGVKTIGERAFFGTNIAFIEIPESVTEIGSGAFGGNEAINNIIVDSENYIIENSTLYNADKTTLMLCFDSSNPYFDVPSSVTKIDDYAFYRRYNMQNINLTNSVKTIGDGAFEQSNITYIYLSNNLTSIGKNAFAGCYQLNSVEIPSGIKEIPSNAFSNCNQLRWVTFADSIEKIGGHAFFGCSQLTEINLNEGLKTIGRYAFYNCGHYYIDVPASVTSIGECALYANNLERINVSADSESYTSIDGVLYTKDKKQLLQYPIMSYRDLLIVPNGTEKIAHNAFYYANVKEVILPNSMKEIGNMAFYNSTLEFINLPDSITNIGYNVFDSTNIMEIALPDNLETVPSGIFSNCQRLSNVTIGTGTKTIENSAFTNSSLCNLYINGNLETIQNYTFENMNNFNNVFFAGTQEQWNAVKIEGMNNNLYNANIHYNADNITGITINKPELTLGMNETAVLSAEIYGGEDDVEPWFTSIGDAVEVDYDGTVTANMPGSAIVIAHAPGGFVDICVVYVGAEGNCGDNVTWSYDGDGTLTISGTGDMYNYGMMGDGTDDETSTWQETPWMEFSYEITTVKIENGVTSIGNYAFMGMPRLTSVEIGNTVTTIGEYAFEGSFITKLHLPASVTTLKDEVFSACEELKEITVDSASTSFAAVDGILYNKQITKLIKIPYRKIMTVYEIPSTVVEIAAFAAERTTMKALVIPEGVTAIGERAFAHSDGLMNIMLPASVKTIGEDAFRGIWIHGLVYGGTEQQLNELVPPTTDAAEEQSPLQTAPVKIFNSTDKVHTQMLDCFTNAYGLEVCAEVVAFRPFTAVASVYDSNDKLIATKVENVEKLSDFVIMEFNNETYAKGAKVRFFVLDSMTSMQPVGASIEEIYKNVPGGSGGSVGGGGSGSGSASTDYPEGTVVDEE